MENEDNWRQQMRDDDERANMQATIDALVAALEAVKTAHDWDGAYPEEEIDAALALARGEG